jgi:hypothetical protein
MLDGSQQLIADLDAGVFPAFSYLFSSFSHFSSYLCIDKAQVFSTNIQDNYFLSHLVFNASPDPETLGLMLTQFKSQRS